MRYIRWNSFTVIGVVLVAIGLFGLVRGPSFEFDAGLPAEPHEALYYIVVGVLMIVNGLVVPRPLTEVAANPTPSAEASDAPAIPSKSSASAGTK